MSTLTPQDLRTLMADPENGGTYFVDVDDREAMADIARELGFALATIDFTGCATKAEALERFSCALSFPGWFGGNWDALADCLHDLSWWPASGYLLLLDHAGGWRNTAADDFATLVAILDEAAARWAGDDVPFWALVPLPARRLEAPAASGRPSSRPQSP